METYRRRMKQAVEQGRLESIPWAFQENGGAVRFRKRQGSTVEKEEYLDEHWRAAGRDREKPSAGRLAKIS